MPITLNHSNIAIQYSTGSNYIIETVKSDLYRRDSRIGISSNLTAEPTYSPSVLIRDVYFPRTPATNSATWTDIIYTVNVKVSDAPIADNQDYGVIKLFNNIIISDDCYHSKEIYTTNGTTYNGTTSFKGDAGFAIGIDLGRPIYPKRIRIAPRADYPGIGSMIEHAPRIFKIYASNNPSSWNDNNHSDWILIHSQTSAATFVNLQYTIITLSNIPSISYRYYTLVVLSVINRPQLVIAELGIGGDELMFAIPEGNPITHKTLNFGYTPNYPLIQADNTNLKAWYKFDGNYNDSSPSGFNLTNSGTVIVNGLIVQSVSADASDFLETSGINLNGKTYSISFWAKFNTTPTATDTFFFSQGVTGSPGLVLNFAYQSGNKLRFSHWGGVNDMDTTGYDVANMIGTSWHHYVATYNNTNRAGEIWFDAVKLNTNISTFANAFSGSGNFIIAKSNLYGGTINGLMEDFRYYDKILTSTEISQLYNIFTQNTYALNFPVPTLADINNNSNIVLRGAYDIALSTSNAIIIPKEGQYIPKPTTFTNYTVERMYPPVRNFTAATTAVSGQTYGNGTYVVSFSSTLGIALDPWTCFNTASGSGGHWAASRYTASVFNSTSFIVAGYLGDWIKIQMPSAIKLTRFEFLSRIGYLDRSPKDFKIYGSNDNITWVELVNKKDAIYNASNKYEQTTPEITKTYTYYGVVVNKLLGSTGTVLNFDEWYIYGQEILPSSLSLSYNLLNPILDPIGAQWTYSSNNTNVYHMGSVGIGTTSPEYNLDVRGNIFSSSGGFTQSGLTTWSITSDRRIKENIVKASYDKCLENVKNIELYNFNFKDNCVNTNDRHQLGFIAQEVQQVYPKAVEVGKMIVNTNETIDNVLTLNTTQIKYTLYGAVKELINKVEMLETKINT